MAKRKLRKPGKLTKRVDPAARLRKALSRHSKDELIEVLVEIATCDRKFLRQLAGRFELRTPPEELVAATRIAIGDATAFDERDVNRNFDCDYEAYEEVKKNFQRLVELGQLRPAMDLALELMAQGSYQVEMSDEGLMTDDIQECFKPVLEALKTCDLPAAGVIAWCAEMVRRDRVAFICNQELQALRKQFETRRSS